ncbi:Acyl-CoA dehydrogenase [Streptomyces sp. MBT84]|nr:Acyl-CoA dehydrogenase [Streptomyces sp. MBT84]
MGMTEVPSTARITEDERSIVEVVADFVDNEVLPVVRQLEHADTYPEELIEQMKRLGVFGLLVPAEYGGVDVSTACFALVAQELARGWMSLAGAMGGHSVVAYLIRTFGTPEQKATYLSAMATGALRATMALTEPGGGSDLKAMRTKAVLADGTWTVNGSKTWITNSRRAGLIALLTRTEPEQGKGFSILLVEKDAGYEVSRDLPKRRWCHQTAGGAPAHPGRCRPGGRRRACRHGGRHGQALRVRGLHGGHPQRDPDPRRLRLLHRV